MVGQLIAAALALAALAHAAAADYPTAYDIGSFMPGVPANSAIFRIALPRAVTLPAGLPNAQCTAKEAATGSTTITLNKVSGGTTTAVGTLAWSASGTACAVTFSTAVSFVAGDIIEEAFPATADATLGDIAITLPAVRR
jgi:hypothetical protein